MGSYEIADTASTDKYLECIDPTTIGWYPVALLSEYRGGLAIARYGFGYADIYDFGTRRFGNMTWDFWRFLRSHFDPENKDEFFIFLEKEMKKRRKLNRCGHKEIWKK